MTGPPNRRRVRARSSGRGGPFRSAAKTQDRADDADALAFGNAPPVRTRAVADCASACSTSSRTLPSSTSRWTPGDKAAKISGCGSGTRSVAGRGVEIEADVGPFLHDERPFGHRAEAQLRPLEVGQDGDRAAGPGLDIAHDIQTFPMVLVAAVAEIETENVGPASNRAWMTSRLELAGPSVATILA